MLSSLSLQFHLRDQPSLLVLHVISLMFSKVLIQWETVYLVFSWKYDQLQQLNVFAAWKFFPNPFAGIATEME